MTTYPHSNPNNGYAIRISKNLPKDAANLSYVHVDKPTPFKNINLRDYTDTIQENKHTQNEETIKAHIDEVGQLVVDQEVFKSKTPDLLLTNEYAYNTNETPLFFKYKSQKPFDTENIQVSVPISGNRLSAPRFIHHYTDGKETRFVYQGDKVQITKNNQDAMTSDDVFKVTLEKEADKYYLVIYSAKELFENTYYLHYPAIIGNMKSREKEIMNLDTVFKEETQVKDYLSKNNFKVVENEDYTYSVVVDKNAGNFLITEKEREPYNFKYRLRSKVKTVLGDKNRSNVNIGIIYLNDTIYNALQTTASLKKIVYGNPYMPDYLTFDNPHRKSEGIHEKTNSEYWEASMTMPKEHWLDYDIIIISGYGEYDISRMNQSLRNYLKFGGTVIVESAGEGDQVLELLNNQITNIKFSKTQKENTLAEILETDLMDRRHVVSSMSTIGSINPAFEFTGEEVIEDWTRLIGYENNSVALASKTIEGAGQLIYSNLGLMKDILLNETKSMKLFVNLIIHILEERFFITPIRNEFVYHKDDLYKEEYKTEHGADLYLNGRADEDQTQIVARKVLGLNAGEMVAPYLPKPYRNWNNIEIEPVLYNKEVIEIDNPYFNESYEEREFTETTNDAIPGFRYISFSGVEGKGSHQPEKNGTEPSHILIETNNTQAFFEQNLGHLRPGNYRIEAKVKSEYTTDGGIGLYDTLGEKHTSKEVYGTHGWKTIQLDFKVTNAKTLYLRLGAHEKPSDSKLYFSELSMTNEGPIRMSPINDGTEMLYAYAISPKGKNSSLVAYEETYNNPKIIIENQLIQTTLRVKSYVYRWQHSEDSTQRPGNFQIRGNEKEIPVEINTSDKKIVLGNILEFLPPLYSGVEWSRKQNVFYEFEIDHPEFLNISVYDPTVDKYFFTADGNWIVNHEDIWWDSNSSTIQISLETDHYHLIATDNQFTLREKDSQRFKVELPYSAEEKDRWYFRVQNGSFIKNSINANELEELKQINRETQYDDNLIGEHLYQMPEYQRQGFYPYHGERIINSEQAVYINSNKVQVANTPLVINELNITKERLRPNSNGIVWSSQNIFWDSVRLPDIYLDQHNTGQLILINSGYRIDYREGKVILDEALPGVIYASYEHDNFKIYKRNYENKTIKHELVSSRDGYAFNLNNKNISVTPAPKLYLGEPSKETLIHPSSYWLDYEAGLVHFSNNINTRVYADYTYYTEEEIDYTDVNKNTGEIYLKQRISFRDEVYVTYSAKENTLEYKGYYDEELEEYIGLDLNPSVGHQFDYLFDGKVERLEGYDLLDKEIFVYLLPNSSTYYKKVITRQHTIKHIFHKEQWDRIKEAQPEAILIAQLQVRENTNKENIVLMDARTPGGGLKESVSEESIERRLGYTSSFWDIGSFDGLAYYKNGVIVVEVPEKVLIESGGDFSQDDVRDILSKYMAYGIYPIIEYIKE